MRDDEHNEQKRNEKLQSKTILKIIDIIGYIFLVLALISLGIFELVSIGDIYEPYYFFIDSELHI